jgi:hypothetical protein
VNTDGEAYRDSAADLAVPVAPPAESSGGMSRWMVEEAAKPPMTEEHPAITELVEHPVSDRNLAHGELTHEHGGEA